MLSRVDLGEGLRDEAKQLLEWRGVTVLTGEGVTNLQSLVFNKKLQNLRQVVTTPSKDYEVDLVFDCTGLRPEVSLTKDSLGTVGPY